MTSLIRTIIICMTIIFVVVFSFNFLDQMITGHKICNDNYTNQLCWRVYDKW